MNRMKTRWDGLIGLYGHSFLSCGDMDWQFRLVAQHGNLYGLQLYSWRDGKPMDEIRLMGADELAKCNIYPTETEMFKHRDSWLEHSARKQERDAERRRREYRDTLIAEFS